MWLLVPVMAGAALVSLLPVGTAVAVVGAVAVALALAAWAVLASPTIAVVDGELVAGRARVPVTLLGRSLAARGPDARQERGPELDARAFLLIRGWVDPVLKVELVDPNDPTPYWLLSTRRPEALAEAVETAQAGTRPSPDAGR